MKKITIDRYNIIGELNKIMQKSKGDIKLMRVIQVKIIIEGEIHSNKLDIYLKSGCMPILWRKNFLKVVNDRDIFIIDRKTVVKSTFVISMKDSNLFFLLIIDTQIV